MTLLRFWGAACSISIIVLTTFLPEDHDAFIMLAILLACVSFSVGWADEEDTEYFIICTCLLVTGFIGINFLADYSEVLRESSSMLICGLIGLVLSVVGDVSRGMYSRYLEKQRAKFEKEVSRKRDEDL